MSPRPAPRGTGRERAARTTCVLDASLLLALGKAGALDLLFGAVELDLVIARSALDEVRSPETRGPVDRAIAAGRLRVVALTSDDRAELGLLADLSESLDAGEAECVALGLARGWLIGLEDRAAQRVVRLRGHNLGCLTCADLLVRAVGAGRLRLDEADEVFRSLDVYPGDRRRGIDSIAKLLRSP